jgi:hypothetical protein
MRGAIVDLDRDERRGGDVVSITALCAGAILFALLVVTRGPQAVTPTAAPVAAADTSSISRGTTIHTLQLPRASSDVELEWMPERLTNEASPASLRQVITVRGLPGVASVETPYVISWSESGVVYWLISPTRSTSELISIADDLAP